MVCPEVLLFLSLGVAASSLLIKMLPISPVLPEFYHEQLISKDTDTKWRQGYQTFFLFLVNLCAQVRSQCFSAKAA
jgi:hypothetical protein